MKINKFQGVIPKIRSDKLGAGFAAFAENCLLHSGGIVPLRAPRPLYNAVDINGKPMSGEVKALYKIGGAWLGFEHVTPIAEDPIHIAGPQSFLFVSDNQVWRSGYAWITDKEGPVALGIPRPIKAPDVKVTGQKCPDDIPIPDDCWQKSLPTEQDCPNQELPPLVLTFCYTWVTDCQEESGPSDYSEPILVPYTESVMLVPTEKAPVNAATIRWYMLLVGDKDAEMAQVGEQAATKLAFVFCPGLFAGGNPLMTQTWYPVPCAEGVANIGYGAILVWSGCHIYVSAHKQPHAFPEANTLVVDDEIVRIVSFRTKTGAYQAVVLTKGVPFVITGELPDKLTITRINRRMPCLSVKGVMCIGESVYYCSEEGIAVVTGAGVGLLTANWMDKEWWLKMAPQHYVLGFYDQRIFAFTDNAQSLSIMFPLRTNDQAYAETDLVYLSHRTHALYFGDETSMAVAFGSMVFGWEQNDYAMQATWKSALFSATNPESIGVGVVHSDAEDVPSDYRDWVSLVWRQYRRLLTPADTGEFLQKYPDASIALPYIVAPKVALTLMGNERIRIDRPVWSDKPFRVNGQGLVRRWQIEVKSTAVVSELALAANMTEL
ncbi:hypothetical protein [Xenorhabdus innexi]|uniref:Uncharacterized protein n=1 Tax=Xenorhabdus innexi TaxID=290109 RepID=A0A1N6MWL4_9GAMM|nr:hypothetical protein [Xenorhabdus innexi]PHM35921.1 hypothetical protein Xinn_01991 [Xenorhabdus innexi]SIP73220.1 hypothetical protein XIS1_1790026 [Xenorhabdus innexi]